MKDNAHERERERARARKHQRRRLSFHQAALWAMQRGQLERKKKAEQQQ